MNPDLGGSLEKDDVCYQSLISFWMKAFSLPGV